MTSIDPYRTIIEQRIADLLHDRRWYRTQSSPAYWFDLAQEARRELLVLLRIRREARKLAAAAPDPITAAKAESDREYHPWQSSAAAEAVR